MSSGSVAVAAVERLRRLAPALAEGGEDERWLGQALDRYLREAQAGLNVDAALGLCVGPGASPWWRAGQAARRDELMRVLASETAGSDNAKAVALQQKLRRYAGTSWPRDRQSKQPSAANSILFEIFSLDPDPPTGISRLTKIISQ